MLNSGLIGKEIDPGGQSSHPFEVQLLHSISVHLVDQTKIDELQSTLDQLEIAAAQGDERDYLAFVQLQRAATLMIRGDSQAAWPYLQRARQLAIDQHLPRMEGIILRALGNTWRQRGDYRRFEDCLLEALAIQRKDRVCD